ncbi:MAG: RNA polymerase sigma-70 factor [Cyclobacteriaceae bacterium]
MQHDDASLLKALQQGNHAAFKQLYETYWEHLYAVAYHWLGVNEEVQEIVQDVFVELWAKRSTLNIQKSLSSYLFAAVKYKVFDCIDAKQVRRRHFSSVQQSYPVVDWSTEQGLALQETRQTLTNALQSLPPKTQQIFHLSREQELTHTEIAQKLNLSVKSVEYHITKALRYLRLVLKSISFLPLLLSLFP